MRSLEFNYLTLEFLEFETPWQILNKSAFHVPYLEEENSFSAGCMWDNVSYDFVSVVICKYLIAGACCLREVCYFVCQLELPISYQFYTKYAIQLMQFKKIEV